MLSHNQASHIVNPKLFHCLRPHDVLDVSTFVGTRSPISHGNYSQNATIRIAAKATIRSHRQIFLPTVNPRAAATVPLPVPEIK